MRFLPRTKVLQENLDLHIVNIEKAIEKLLKDKVIGYILFSFDPENEAIMIIENDRIPDQFYIGSEKFLRGVEAKNEIAEQLNLSKGFADIIELNNNAFSCLLALLYGDSYFGPLESSYVIFPGLLNQIRESHLNGCLTIDGSDDNVLIFFSDGKPSSLYFRGIHVRKGTKAEVDELVKNQLVELEFFVQPTEVFSASDSVKKSVDDEKEVLHLQKVMKDGQAWFEDQYGNRYKKNQIKDLWEKYHLVL